MPGSVVASPKMEKSVPKGTFSKEIGGELYTGYCAHESENDNIPYESQLNECW